jgi:dTDP-4-amino-4,6-dideoxy-D-galactose acyltransferase
VIDLSIRHLEWDSNFFNFKVGYLDIGGREHYLGAILSQARCAEYRCLYSLIDAEDRAAALTLSSRGFSLTDVRIELTREVSDPIHPALMYDLRLGTEDDVECLALASKGTFNKSRFYSDPHFPRRHCDELYNEWIRRDCTTKDRMMVVAESRGWLAGFWSASISEGIGQTGLGFVDPLFRGMGVPASMMAFMSDQLEKCGVGVLRAATQGSNIPAVKMHLNCGFKFSGTKLWYHGWL